MNRCEFLRIFPAAAATCCLPSCLAPGVETVYSGSAGVNGGGVMLGIDRLARDGFGLLRGKRVGLITNQTGVAGSGELSRRVLQRGLGNGLTVLFAPEHGLDSRVRAGMHVANTRDSVTGLPAYSLYAANRKPSREMLANVDTVVFDVQDIGCRSYTYISTMAQAMEACGEMGKDFIVLDRPNPLGGNRVQGPPIERSWKSFVGQMPVPYVHGLTVGELAKMINGHGWIGARPRLMVVPMLGYQRRMTWRQTGLGWVATSPNIPHVDSPFYYVATGMLGGMDGVDIGIGTSQPFQYAGGRGVNGAALAQYLNQQGFRDVQFRPYVSSNKPGFSGVELRINPAGETDLCALGVMLCREIVQRTGGEPLRQTSGDTLNLFHKVYGSDSLWRDLQRGTSWQNIAAGWQGSLSSFLSQRQGYLLYA